jgi:hypothetical protein
MKLILRFLCCLLILFKLHTVEAQSIPSISRLSTLQANVGDTIMVFGQHFKTDHSAMIMFDGLKTTVIPSTDSTIKFIIPLGAAKGKVVYTDYTFTTQSRQSISAIFSGESEINTTNFNVNKKTTSIPNSTVYIAKADFDHDGKLDIVTSSYSVKSLSVFRNTSPKTYNGAGLSNSSFADGVKLPIDTFAFGVFANDLDNDGWEDIIATNDYKGKVYIFKNLGDTSGISSTSFATPVIIDIPSTNSTEVAFDDLNADGKIDMVVTSADSSLIFVYRNNSTNHTITNQSFQLAQTIKIGACAPLGPIGVRCADLDHDGKSEIITALQCSKELVIIPNESTSQNFAFGAPLRKQLGKQPICLETADLNNDNNTDIIVSINNYGLALITNKFVSAFDTSVLTSNFIPINNVDTYSAFQLNTADVNGDGKVDVSLSVNSFLLIFSNTSNDGGTLDSNNIKQVAYFTIVNEGLSHVSGDFNMDGRVDYISTNLYDDFNPSGSLTLITNNIGHPVGVNEVKKGTTEQTQLYPNPAYSTFFIQSTNKIQQVRILNALGQSIQTHMLETHQQHQLSLDVSALSNGVYYVEVLHQNGMVMMEKLVIQK